MKYAIGRKLWMVILTCGFALALSACGGNTVSDNVRAAGTAFPAILQAAQAFDAALPTAQPAACATICASDTISVTVMNGTTVLDKSHPAEFTAGQQITLTATLPAGYSGSAIEWCLPDNTIFSGSRASFFAPDYQTKTNMTVLINVTHGGLVYHNTIVLVINPSGTATAATQIPATASATSMPSAPTAPAATPAPATPTAAAPSPVAAVTPIQNTNTTTITFSYPFPENWSEQDDFPVDYGELGHTMLWTYLQVTVENNMSRTAHIAVAPGYAIDLAAEFTGTRYYNGVSEISNWLKQVQIVTARDKFAVNGLPDPDLYVINADGTISIYADGASTATVTTTLPDGITLRKATYSALPVVDPAVNGCSLGADNHDQFQAFNVAQGVDLPLGDDVLTVYGETSRISDGLSIKFTVAKGIVARIPSGWMGKAQHWCAAPANLPADVLVINDVNNVPQAVKDAGWIVELRPQVP